MRFKGGPLDSVLPSIAKRVSNAAGKPVTEGQVLQLWLKAKGIPAITYVYIAFRSQRMLTYDDI